MSHTDVQPITLYGSNVSYFIGKLENYFRVKGVLYNFHALQAPCDERMIRKNVGVYQAPALTLGDGRWMTDSTKIIQWFETQYPHNSLLPRDPLQVFVCLLLEDYADRMALAAGYALPLVLPEGGLSSEQNTKCNTLEKRMGFEKIERAIELNARIQNFMDEHIYPREHEGEEFTLDRANLWQVPTGLTGCGIKPETRASGTCSYRMTTSPGVQD